MHVRVGEIVGDRVGVCDSTSPAHTAKSNAVVAANLLLVEPFRKFMFRRRRCYVYSSSLSSVEATH